MTAFPGKLSGFIRRTASSRSLKRMLWIYIGVSLILFVMIVGIILNNAAVRYEEQRGEKVRSSLEQAMTINEKLIRSMQEYTLTYMETYEIRSMLYGSEFFLDLAISSRDLYTNVVSVSSIIKNAQFVNYTTRTVLDMNGRYAFDGYGDPGVLQLLETLPPNRSPVSFYSRDMNLLPTTKAEKAYSVISMIYYANKAGALVVNLDQEAYRAMLIPGTVPDDACYILINQNGLVFTSSDDALISTEYAGDVTYQAMNADTRDAGSFSLTRDRTSMTVYFIKNTPLGISYLALLPRAQFHPGMALYQSILCAGVLFMLGSALVSYLLALATTKPLRLLHKSVSERVGGDLPSGRRGTDEIGYLNSAYQRMIESNEQLRESAAAYATYREGRVLLSLLNPDIPTADPDALSEVENTFPYRRYRLMILLPEQSGEAQEQDAWETRASLSQIVMEAFGKTYTLRPIILNTYRLVCLINYDSAPREDLRRILEDARKAFEARHAKYALYAGVGCEVEELDDISLSFAGAEETLRYAITHEESGVRFTEDIALTDRRRQAYPYQIDEEILTSVKRMQPDAANAAITRFIDCIADYYSDQFVRCILQLDAAFQRFEYNAELTSGITAGSEDMIRWTIRQARTFFEARAAQDIAQLNDIRKRSTDNAPLIQEINRIVQDEICDPALSVCGLAERFSLSVNYLRSLYKDGTGKSLSAFINECKVRKACDYLDNTDETIDAISERLGFSTKNYFFTFFKKHTGETPTQYRTREH